jgi:pimeloyl-ACP methyl ester carboxylesterase
MILVSASGVTCTAYGHRQWQLTPGQSEQLDADGNLDNWAPALIDALPSARRVATFDNVGVDGSSGATRSTVAQMARDAIAFLDALDLAKADLLDFSIGSFVAQEIALIRPSIVRRLVLASSAPRGAAGMHGWATDANDAIGAPKTIPDSSTSSIPVHRQVGTLASRP